MTRPSLLFAADAVPRYEEAEQRDLVSNLISQRAFLTTMLTEYCQREGAWLEIRFAGSASGEIKLFVATHREDGSAANRDSTTSGLAARLLPGDYGWRLSDDLDGYRAGIEDKAYVARVVRTAQILDLPYATRDLDGALGSAVAETVAGITGGAIPVSTTPLRPGRCFPDLTLGSLDAQAQEGRLCLPFLGSLTGWRTEMRVLFEQMLSSSPAIISIGLRPLREIEIEGTRPLAANWKGVANQFLGQLANSGLADAPSLARTFDRFAVPANQLVQVSIKCAALSDDIATAIAAMLASCLGGPAAFEILPPTRSADIGILRDMDGDYPVPGPEGVAEEEWLKKQWDRLAVSGVSLPRGSDETDERNLEDLEFHDRAVLQFMMRVNHVYTLDEAHAIAELPVADEKGLPGLVTRMPAPFSAPWSRSRESEDSLRVGVVQRRKNDPLADPGDTNAADRWHRIPVEALTKHALIVGSTGSGKTLTTLFLARELKRNRIPFLVVEPVKTEYYQRLRNCMSSEEIARWRFEGDSEGRQVKDFLPFEPMTLQQGVSVARHAAYLKSCFLAAFPLPPVEALLLEAGLRDYYTADARHLGCGLTLFTRGGPETTFRRLDPMVTAEGQRARDERGAVRQEWMVHPSMKGFFKYFNAVFLRHKVLGRGRGNADDILGRIKRLIGEPPAEPERAKALATALGQLRGMAAAGGGGNARLGETLVLWQQMFARRFESIESGPLGLAASIAAQQFEQTGAMPDLEAMLATDTIIELDGIPDEEQKSLMMAFLLTSLFERRQADDLAEREAAGEDGGPVRRGLRHVMIVEEAHRVLSNSGSGRSGEVAGMDAKAKSVALFVDMLAEIRAFGQGLVIVEQIPTKIVSEAIKNTNLKIMLRLTSRDDREYLGEAMNFTDSQKRFVTTLRAERGKGIGMVMFEEGVEQPIMLSLPFDPTGDDWIFDELF